VRADIGSYGASLSAKEGRRGPAVGKFEAL